MSTENYQAIKAKITALREEAKEAASTCFKKAAAGIFAKHPQLTSFSWNQYTPYFNDGDTCEFSAHTDYPSLNTVDADGEENEDADDEVDYEWEEEDKPGTHSAWKVSAYKEVKELLAVFDDEDYKAMFDDHVRVTVTRDKVETEEYNHD